MVLEKKHYLSMQYKNTINTDRFDENIQSS